MRTLDFGDGGGWFDWSGGGGGHNSPPTITLDGGGGRGRGAGGDDPGIPPEKIPLDGGDRGSGGGIGWGGGDDQGRVTWGGPSPRLVNVGNVAGTLPMLRGVSRQRMIY